METLSANSVAKSDLEKLDDVRSTLPSDSTLGAALTLVSDSMRRGVDLTFIESDASITPAVAARLLGMSRTHLYKLLDAGTVPSVAVGRDRRIRMSDVRKFELERRAERARLAERFAHADADRVRLMNELTAP